MDNLHTPQPSESGPLAIAMLPSEITEAAEIVANAAYQLSPHSTASVTAALASSFIDKPAPLFLVSTTMPTKYAEKDATDALLIVKAISAISGQKTLKPLPRTRYDYAVDDIQFGAIQGRRVLCFQGINTPTRARSLSNATHDSGNPRHPVVFGIGFDGHGTGELNDKTVWICTDGSAERETIEGIIHFPQKLGDALRVLTTGDHMDAIVQPEEWMWNVPERFRAWQRKVDVVNHLTQPLIPTRPNRH